MWIFWVSVDWQTKSLLLGTNKITVLRCLHFVRCHTGLINSSLNPSLTFAYGMRVQSVTKFVPRTNRSSQLTSTTTTTTSLPSPSPCSTTTGPPHPGSPPRSRASSLDPPPHSSSSNSGGQGCSQHTRSAGWVHSHGGPLPWKWML